MASTWRCPMGDRSSLRCRAEAAAWHTPHPHHPPPPPPPPPPPTGRGKCSCSLPGNRSTAEQELQPCPTSRKVERPMARLSEAPMRVKTASSTCRVADWAGTRHPTCRQGMTPKRWRAGWTVSMHRPLKGQHQLSAALHEGGGRPDGLDGRLHLCHDGYQRHHP